VNMRRLVLGESGAAPALVLAGMALVVAFIVTAAPLALASAGNRATRQALGQAPSVDSGAQFSADMPAGASGAVLGAALDRRLGNAFGALLPFRRQFPAGRSWAGVSVPALPALNAAPSAVASGPPIVELDYRSALAANSALVAGSYPSGPGPESRGRSGHPTRITLTIAVTQATAARFSMRVGSRLDLGNAFSGGPAIWLRVTGIVRPVAPASAFWQFEPALAGPLMEGSSQHPFWQGAMFTGPGDLPALARAYSFDAEQATWFFPLSTDLTTQQVPRLEAGLARLAASAAPRNAETAAHADALQNTAVTTGLTSGLALFTAQWQSVAGADSLLVVGLFAAGLVLLLVCCGMAAQAYGPELALLRARGCGVVQLAGRMLARSACVTLLPAAAGVALAIVVVPGQLSRTAVVLTGLIAATAILGTPLLCVAAHRRLRPGGGGRSGSDLAVGRPSVRRITGEVAVLLVACAVLADLRLRGGGVGAGVVTPGVAGGGISASTGVYLSASAVLVAAAVGVIVNRIYRSPLRALARMSSARRGPVGAVGLARAAALSARAVLPALALMLTLTLAAFSVMTGVSIAAGQAAASWAEVGGDATISVAGSAAAISAGQRPVVTAADLRAIERVPGVLHATAIYTAHRLGSLSVNLHYGSSTSPPLGIAVVSPASYAALSAGTPWPHFPASRLARPVPGSGGAVPILASPGAAASAAGRPGSSGTIQLEFSGIGLPVRIVGTIASTAAVPQGGDFVVLPGWAEPRLPSLPKPSTILLTGSAISASALRATVHRVLPGSHVIVRRQVLNALAAVPALHMSDELYLIGAMAAGLLSALAVLFALGASARSRAWMVTRLGAMGMSRRQSVWLGLTDAIPLCCVAAIGTVASCWLLAMIDGPVLGLGVFTGSAVPVPLRLTWPALVIPVAGVAILALIFLVIDGIAAGRRHLGAALRVEEAG
jgi:putative ABC transport system permease protein